MKKLFHSALIIAASMLLSSQVFAQAIVTARPYDINGRPVDPQFVISVNPNGTAASAGGSSSGTYNATLPTLTDGATSSPQLDVNGNQRVVVVTDAASSADAISNSGIIGRLSRNNSHSGAAYLPIVPFIFNGTTWDRVRSFAGTDTAGIGATAVGLLGQYNATLPTYTDGQVSKLQTGTRGSLAVTLFEKDSSTSPNIFGSFTDARSNTVGSLATWSFGSLFNGTTWDRARGDTNGAFTQGNVASGANDAGNPLKMGCVFYTVNPTVTNGQRVDLQCNNRGSLSVLLGDGTNTMGINGSFGSDGISNNNPNIDVRDRLYGYNGTNWDRMRGNTSGLATLPYGLATSRWNWASAAAGIVNTTTATTIKTAAGAGVRNCLDAIQVGHDALGGVTQVVVRDGAAGTVIWRGNLQTTATEQQAQLPAGPGVCGTANTLMEVALTVAVTGAVYVNVQGHVE